MDDWSWLDWLVLVPLIPAIPVVALWWLPWEKWLPLKKMCRTFLGPYLLYAAFASWYFQWGGWYSLFLAIAGTCVSIYALVALESKKLLERDEDL